MGLLKILRKIKLKEHQVRLLTLGLDNSGKTTIIKSFLSQDPTSTSPTLGFTINTLKYKNNQINFWDIGGQTTIRSYWRNYFEETDGVIWVVDSSDKLRIQDCKEELHNLLKQEKLAGATLLVFCNKQDINGALKVEEIKNNNEKINIKLFNNLFKKIFIFFFILKLIFKLMFVWGLGIGDWGLGIGPNPQSPIPNPQSPIPNS